MSSMTVQPKAKGKTSRRSTSGKPGGKPLTRRERQQVNDALRDPMQYIDHEWFDQPRARKEIFDDAPEIPEPESGWYPRLMERNGHGEPQAHDRNVVLSREQEKYLFLQYNYARREVAQLQAKAERRKLTPRQGRDLIAWRRVASRTRERIAQFNLALVLAMAKRVRGADTDFQDLVCEGNMVLLNAIDKFNVSRAFKFSSYACSSILKAFGRIGKKQTRRRRLFSTEYDTTLDQGDAEETTREDHEQACADEVRDIVHSNSAELSELEQSVLDYRFRVISRSEAKPLSLAEVGRLVGLSKERVRQIQIKALTKVRRTLEDGYLDGVEVEEPAEQGDAPAAEADVYVEDVGEVRLRA